MQLAGTGAHRGEFFPVDRLSRRRASALLPMVFFGTLGGPPTERAQAVRTAFRQAGFKARENTDFRGWLFIHFVQNAGLHTQSLKLGSLAELAGKPRNVREAILATRELLPLAEPALHGPLEHPEEERRMSKLALALCAS